jgi:AraC-like DNA-binding protein
MELSQDLLYQLFIKSDYVHNRIATEGWEMSFPASAQENLILIYDGKGYFENENQSISGKMGDVIFFPKNSTKILKTDNTHLLKFYTVNFQCFFLDAKNEKYAIKELKLPFEFVTHIKDGKTYQRLLNLFDRLWRLHLTNAARTQMKQREVIAQILDSLLCYESKEYTSFSSRRRVDKVIQYMISNYREKLTLSKLSDFAGISPSYLNSIFRMETGKSPIDYLINLRITMAKQLLQDGFAVAKAAKETGFSDVYYFSNTFKKLEGISPSEYAKVSKLKK